MESYTRSYSLTESPLLQRLQNYRKIGKYTDIILKVGDREFPAHRMVLEDSSPFLQKLLSNGKLLPTEDFSWISFSVCLLSKFDEKVSMKKKMDVYELDGEIVSQEIMEFLLTFLYTSKITITPRNIHAILIAAKYLQIPSLISFCEQYFIEIFSPEEVLNQFFIAELYKLEKLLNLCLNFYIANGRSIFHSKQSAMQLQFYCLESEDLKTLMCGLSTKIKENIEKDSEESSEKCSEETPKKNLGTYSEKNSKENSEVYEETIIETLLEKPFLEIKEIYTLCHKMYEVVIVWINSDRVNRLSSSNTILRCIPLHVLFFEFDFFEEFISEKSFTNSLSCSKFLTQVMAENLKLRIHEISDLFAKKRQPYKNFKGIFEMEINSGETSKIYCFSEHFSRTVSCMNVSTGEWEKVAHMTSSKEWFSGAVIGSKVYLCGGFETNEVEMFDCSTHTWTQLTPMPHTRWHSAAAALNGYVYVTGGWTKTSDKLEDLSSVNRYNIQTGRWETVTPMNYKRHGHQLIELNGRLYAIQGNGGGAEEYNLSTDQWTKIGKPNYSHIYFGATSHCGKIYVCGSDGFEVYSPESNSWKKLTSVHDGCWGQTLVSVSDKLLAIGGYKNKKTIASVFSYDPTTDQWTQLPDMDTPRDDHCSFVINL